MASCDVGSSKAASASSGGNGVNFIDGGDGDFKRLRWLPVASQWWRRLLHAAAVSTSRGCRGVAAAVVATLPRGGVRCRPQQLRANCLKGLGASLLRLGVRRPRLIPCRERTRPGEGG